MRSLLAPIVAVICSALQAGSRRWTFLVFPAVALFVLAPIYLAYEYSQALDEPNVSVLPWWLKLALILYLTSPFYFLALALIRASQKHYGRALLALAAFAFWAVSLVILYVSAIGCVGGGCAHGGYVVPAVALVAWSVGLSWIATPFPVDVRDELPAADGGRRRD